MEAPEDERSGGPDDVADSTAGRDSHDAENSQPSGESGSDSEESEPETAEERAARAEHYKSLGNDAYVQKEYDDSYEYYTRAVDLAPENAVYLSNRAASLVALQRYSEALVDSRKATEVEPGYSKGWIRLATCHLKVGDFEACDNVLTQAYLRDTRNGKIAAARRKLAAAQETLQQIRTQLDGGEHSGALQSLLELQNLCPGWSHLMILRVEALIGMRKYAAAYAITTDMLRKNASNSDALYWRAQALYFQGDFEKAVKHMQQVMRRDPDNAKCQKVIKQMRKLEKTKARGNQLFKSRDWNGAITAYTECLEIDPDNVLFNAKLLCNRAAALGYLNRHRDVIRDCNKAIDADPRYAKAYIRRAGAFKNIGGVENIERCIDDLKRALEILPGDSAADRQVQRSLRDAQRALKSAKRKDYYKILNVARNADTAAIKKAYKKAALKWHPDRHANKGEAEQKKAEAMFKDVGEALAVLEDPQKRSMYDQGMDLEDIQNGGHGHGHGFGGGHGMGGAGGIDPNILFQMFMGQQGRGF